MIIFSLAVYSCVSFNSFAGDLVSKQCRWDARDLYYKGASCEAAGAKSIGERIFGDVAEDRVVEKYRCGQTSVIVE